MHKNHHLTRLLIFVCKSVYNDELAREKKTKKTSLFMEQNK